MNHKYKIYIKTIKINEQKQIDDTLNKTLQIKLKKQIISLETEYRMSFKYIHT